MLKTWSLSKVLLYELPKSRCFVSSLNALKNGYLKYIFFFNGSRLHSWMKYSKIGLHQYLKTPWNTCQLIRFYVRKYFVVLPKIPKIHVSNFLIGIWIMYFSCQNICRIKSIWYKIFNCNKTPYPKIGSWINHFVL